MLAVDLRPFLSGQSAAVGGAIGSDLVINCLFASFQMSGFAGGQLSALDSLRNALLLIPVALPNFVREGGALAPHRTTARRTLERQCWKRLRAFQTNAIELALVKS